MHQEVTDFIIKVRERYPENFVKKKVLEVGSLDINGSIRPLFIACDYRGIDLDKGPGVDVVSPVHLYNHDNISDFYLVDTLVSTEMLEHDIHWKESLKSMYNVLKSGGLFILTCAGPNRHEHGTKRTTPGDSPFTTDYYRNISIEDFESILPMELFNDYDLKLVRYDCDLQFYGIKK